MENVIQTLKCVFLFIRKHQSIILKANKDIYYNPDKPEPSSNVSFSLKATLCYWKYSCMESDAMSIFYNL